MDHSNEMFTPESAKQVASSRNPTNLGRSSSSLTPCRRLGLSRKSRFSVPFSPVCGAREVSSTIISETACSPNTPVKGKDFGNSDRISACSGGSIYHKQRRPGSSILGKCSFKSPIRSSDGDKGPVVEHKTCQKLELRSKRAKNLTTSEFSNSPSMQHESCRSEYTKLSVNVEDCDSIKVNGNTPVKRKKTEHINSSHHSETQLPNTCVTAISICDNQLKNVDETFSLDSEITDEMLAFALSRVKLKEAKISDLKQKYQRKQQLVAELAELTARWLAGGQAAATDLLTRYKERDGSATMVRLLAGLGIPAPLLHYDPDEDQFQ